VKLDTIGPRLLKFRQRFSTPKGMSVPGHQYTATDGAHPTESHARKAARGSPSDDVCCIYVHAGAGYHSHQNEKIHLEACNEWV
jgi:taspase (threonine aspartase 1)